MGQKGVVAAGHELTAQTAGSILREGGNAFDAVLAAACVACVSEPVLASLGGGGFLLARTPDGRHRCYDFFVQTPQRRRATGEIDFHPVDADFGTAKQQFHIGLGSIATPGFVRGLFSIHRDLGRMPLGEIVAPAVLHARRGVLLNALQSYIFNIVEPIYTSSPDARDIFARRETAGRTEPLRQTELAEVLDLLAIEGEDLFYRGEIAQAIAELCRSEGGHLTLADLENYEVVLRLPLPVDYRGVRVLTNPPPAAGGILIAFALELLGVIQDLGGEPFGSRRHLDLLAHSLQSTEKARVDVLAAARRRAGSQPALDPELLARYRAEILHRADALRGTTHIGVMDSEGNVASMTVSNGEGCGRIVPGTGVMLNNMLGEEDLCEHGFHRWPVDQRMTSMMSPSLLLFSDGRIVATGSGGSNRIRASILQVVLNIVDFGMSISEAVASPRIFWEDGLLSLERGFEERELDGLLEAYPRYEMWDERNLFFGGTHTVERNKGAFSGAGDPRRDGVAIVVR